MTFETLGISKKAINQLTTMGITDPTPVQQGVITKIMNGVDIIVQSNTGTGKTLAFLLPLLEKIESTSNHLQGLIIVPTRELALQINDVTSSLAPLYHINHLAVYGGKKMTDQEKKLKSPTQFIVATPGRLLDLVDRGQVDLTTITHFVLDEADQLLLSGFKPEIERIILNIPGNRQTLFFSATMPPQIKKIAYRYTYQPEYFVASSQIKKNSKIVQEVVYTNDRQKFPALQEVLLVDNPYMAIVFCRTKRRANELFEKFKKYRYHADVLHSDIPQNKRERLLKKFRAGDLQYLIATDVAARGLDVNFITNIYNFDAPDSVETYLHRIGRTGRAGEAGTSCTFVTEADEDLIFQLKKQKISNIKERAVKIGRKG